MIYIKKKREKRPDASYSNFASIRRPMEATSSFASALPFVVTWTRYESFVKYRL